MYHPNSFYKNFGLSFSVVIKTFLILVFIGSNIFKIQNTYANQRNIAVIIPLEHESLKQIIVGIREILNKDYCGVDCDIKVKNAQGDLNLMYSIIKQINNQDVDLVIPIGTQASQLAISIIRNKPIVATAAMIDNEDQPLVTGVNDEISISNFLAIIPKLKNIGVIYSNSEKIAPEIEELKIYAKKNNVKLDLRMIGTLIDLPSSIKTISDEVKGFIILKDHLIVSGINILIQEAEKRKIPIIASDEGSVIAGATMAIGVSEKEIGNIAGKIAKDILSGKSPADIPYQTIEQLTLFVNEKSFKKQNIFELKELESLNLPLQKITDSE